MPNYILDSTGPMASDPAAPKGAGAPETEIEVTPEMVEAAADVIGDHFIVEMDVRQVAKEVLAAALEARRVAEQIIIKAKGYNVALPKSLKEPTIGELP